MESMLVNIVSSLAVGFILLITGLIIEYRTRFFAKHLESLKPRKRGEATNKSKQGFFATNWAETTRQARINLAFVFGVNPNEIIVTDWYISRDIFVRELSIDFKIPQDKALELGVPGLWMETSEPYYNAKVDREGRVKSIHSYV